jgi:ATP-dependent DNA helicase RecG
LIRNVPFDAAACIQATLDDLDEDRMRRFVRTARAVRGFALAEDVSSADLLTHLNLLEHGLPTNAAVLLFGRQPQRFLPASEVECSHFHGVHVANPIPYAQVCRGTVFELVDQAVAFVLSTIDLWVGTRKDGPQVPVAYEIPKEVVTEAIVNAVAHRDYASNRSVQVMLFADRFEVWSPGLLPPTVCVEKLRQKHDSVPRNSLVAEALYLAQYTDRVGAGTGDLTDRCRQAGLAEPEFTQTDGFAVTIRRKSRQRQQKEPPQ